MPLFTFTLDYFEITDTRSYHRDTDYVSFNLRIGNATTESIFASMGPLNNGKFVPGLAFSKVNIVPDTSVVLNYLIFNAGQSPAPLVKGALATLGTRLADHLDFNLPPLGSAVDLVANMFAGELTAIEKAECDGLVAAEQNAFNYGQLIELASRPPYFQQTTSHVGTRSASGCNSRPSAYAVHWSMMQVVIVPNVLGQSFESAQEILQAQSLGAQKSGRGDLVTNQTPKGNYPAGVNSIVTLETNLIVK